MTMNGVRVLSVVLEPSENQVWCGRSILRVSQGPGILQALSERMDGRTSGDRAVREERRTRRRAASGLLVQERRRMHDRTVEPRTPPERREATTGY